MAKYQNKYRIETIRLSGYDYSQAGAYFVTICTKNRAHLFGEIKNGKMILNDYGKIVENEWLKTPAIRKDMNLILDVFIVMPNHFHGIIFVGENEFNTRRDAMHCVSTNTHKQQYNRRDAMHGVSMHGVSTNQFGPQSKNLASIIRGFKSSCTKQINILNNLQGQSIWQSRFYEHIIRDDKELNQIRDYIINNPLNWENDENFIDND